uniref:Unc-112-related protein n=1 Tax=Scolopendra viridis TaxID=118503 RepID=A0A4D5R9Q1_SCOVI
MMADGYLVGDGSWELRIFVTDLQVERNLRVKGDLHIGGVMLKLVEDLDIAIDWSDHALWWPEKNMWLSRTRSTLDQCGVQADALLHFTPMHKTLRLQLPDLRYIDANVNFSCKVFNAIVNVCKDLGIRHPEELSFGRPLTQDDLKRNYRTPMYHPRHRQQHNTSNLNTTMNSTSLSTNSLDKSGSGGALTPKTPGTPVASPLSNSTWRANCNYSPYNGTFNGTFSPSGPNASFDSMNGGGDTSLAHSPQTPSTEAKQSLVRPRNLAERARINSMWLDSSLSLMEQNVKEFDTLLLRYKFFTFYDLNPKYDSIRINQIYEQAKWSLLSEEIDCTEEEMMMFAALQLQVNLQSQLPQPEWNTSTEDDIDAALTDLQVTLEGSAITNSHGPMTKIPELCDYLRFLKPKKLTLKGFRRYYFVFKDTTLSYYKNRDDVQGQPIHKINLKGCEVTPDVNISSGKYGIKLEVPTNEGMSENCIRCDSEQQYAKWMAACRLASKGKTMADSSYDGEVQSILAFLSMQHPAPAPAINPNSLDINVEDYVAPRFLKKLKGKQMATRILEAHANVKDLNLNDAKMNYIKAWQALPDYGVALFIVKFTNSKKEELLGIAFNRLMRMDLHSGDHIKTWRYNTMRAWNVNWEVKHVRVEFEEEPVVFSCLSADCKIVHEYIGGYIFLSMRSKDQNQVLNEELFHKLTGGWV